MCSLEQTPLLAKSLLYSWYSRLNFLEYPRSKWLHMTQITVVAQNKIEKQKSNWPTHSIVRDTAILALSSIIYLSPIDTFSHVMMSLKVLALKLKRFSNSLQRVLRVVLSFMISLIIVIIKITLLYSRKWYRHRRSVITECSVSV